MLCNEFLSLPRRSGSARNRLASAGLLVAAALVAGGCSINTYKPAVDGFAVAAGKASGAYAGLQTTVLSAHTERLEQSALTGKVRVRYRPNDCQTQSQRCRLEVTGGGKPPEDLVPELGNITLLMHEIADYAANLQAVVNSDTAEQVSANLSAAGGSIKNLSGELAKAPGAGQAAGDIGAFATPSANLAAWIAGEYVNSLQVEALRKATQSADPVIQQARSVLDGAASAAADVTRSGLADQLDAIRDDYLGASNDRGRLERLMSAAADYDKVLTATAPGVFADMAMAHHELTDHLAGRNVSLADAFAAIQRFGAKADALQGIIDEFRAARAQAPAAKK